MSLVYQHSPRDLANVNECKIMFDPSSDLLLCLSFREKSMMVEKLMYGVLGLFYMHY